MLRPREYYRRFVERGVRPDGRSLDAVRTLSVSSGSIGTAAGSAMVSLGKTMVLAGVTCVVGEPLQSSPESGVLQVRVRIGPMCSDDPALRTMRVSSDEAYCVEEHLKRCMLSSDALDVSDLCIESGKAVWILTADIVCLNHDGNVWDAAMIALIASLNNTSIPSNVDIATDGSALSLKIPRVVVLLSTR